MAKRELNRLIATQLNKLPKGMHSDGGNLWLQVSKWGTRSWIFRFTVNGKQREMGFGPLHTITLANARTLAQDARKLLLEGVDPIEQRNAKREAAARAAAAVMTFKQCAEAYIESNKAAWGSTVHARQWPSTMRDYVYPVIGETPVGEIDVSLVLKVVEPIWTAKNETASRVRQRIEKVLSWATVSGYRSGENPARWAGHLDQMLPAKSKVAKVEHQPAMDYSQLPEFMALLRRRKSTSALALQFTILTGVRTSATSDAVWSEIDRKEKTWTIPGTRKGMKGKTHIVPLTDDMLAILDQMEGKDDTYIFPGSGKSGGLSNMAQAEMLKGINGDPPRYVDRETGRAATVHGFRSTFRDWAGEETSHPGDVIEMAMAHTIRNKVEAAYRRREMLAKRRALMEDWGKFCASGTADVGADDKVLEIAAHLKRDGRSHNRAVRDAIDAAAAFADIDLGDGPAIASTDLHELVRATDLRRKPKPDAMGADEATPPDFAPSLRAEARPVRRLAVELEERERG